MKKRNTKWALAIICMMISFALNAQPRVPGQERKPLENVIYQYRDTSHSILKRAQNGPQLMIYPDKSLSAAEAEALVDELGLKAIVNKQSGSIGVFKPVGATYDNTKDFEAYKKFIDASRVIGNLKIIGFGRGATFVNNIIAPNANEVAGIFTYGGKLNAKESRHSRTCLHCSWRQEAGTILYPCQCSQRDQPRRTAHHLRKW
jgi:hypothetical protein